MNAEVFLGFTFLYRHSLGGSIVLNYLNNDPAVKGAIVTSPWLNDL